MKKIGFALIMLLSSLFVFGNESVSVGILNGPSSIPTAYMMDNVTTINDADLSFEKYADPKALLPKLIKKEVDIGFLPVNVAAKVFNSTNGAIVCCAITGNGNICLITKDKSVKAFSDLKGKKVNVAGQGATPDYLFKYLLTQNGIEINGNNGVELDFSIPTNQLAALLIAGKINYAVVPEPFVSVAQLKSKDVTVAFDFQKEYKNAAKTNSEYPLTVMVCTKEFLENHKDLLNSFLAEYEKSYNWTVKNPRKAGQLSVKYNLGFTEAVAARAIPKSNYCFIEASKGVKEIEALLNLFLANAPVSIGGKLPGQDFYYSGE